MILIPVVAATIQNAYQQIRLAEKANADGVELRLDALRKIKTGEIAKLVQSTKIIVLATCRTKKEGGFSNKKPSECQRTLLEAIAAGAKMVDVELFAPAAIKKAVRLSANKTGCRVVVSVHDFKKTPAPKILEKWVKKALAQGDIAKIVCLTKNTNDNLQLLELVKKAPGCVVAFGMGKQGMQSRIMSLLYGAPFGFASLSKKSASGQMPLSKMRLALLATANLVDA